MQIYRVAHEIVCPILASLSNRGFISYESVLHLKSYFVVNHPGCPWGSRHHMTKLAAAQNERERGGGVELSMRGATFTCAILFLSRVSTEVQIMIYWLMKPCRLVDAYRCLGGKSYLHL